MKSDGYGSQSWLSACGRERNRLHEGREHGPRVVMIELQRQHRRIGHVARDGMRHAREVHDDREDDGAHGRPALARRQGVDDDHQAGSRRHDEAEGGRVREQREHGGDRHRPPRAMGIQRAEREEEKHREPVAARHHRVLEEREIPEHEEHADPQRQRRPHQEDDHRGGRDHDLVTGSTAVVPKAKEVRRHGAHSSGAPRGGACTAPPTAARVRLTARPRRATARGARPPTTVAAYAAVTTPTIHHR
jgi:hypothetical protein